MNNSGPFGSHSLNLIYNMFTQFTSASKLTKIFVSFQLSSFFACTLSMIQGFYCDALNAAVVTIIAAFKKFLKIYYFSVLIYLCNLYEMKVSFSTLLKYILFNDINNIQYHLYSNLCISADCVLMTF